MFTGMYVHAYIQGERYTKNMQLDQHSNRGSNLLYLSLLISFSFPIDFPFVLCIFKWQVFVWEPFLNEEWNKNNI